jgi:hypothetical protein
MDRLQEIKKKVQNIKELHADGNYVEGDNILYELLDDGDIDWLMDQLEPCRPAAKKPSYMDLDDQ